MNSSMAGNSDSANLGPIDASRYMDSLLHPLSLRILIDYVQVEPKKRQSHSGLHGSISQKNVPPPTSNPK